MAHSESSDSPPVERRDVTSVGVSEAVHLEATTDGVLKGVRDVDGYGRSLSADIPDDGTPRVRLEAPTVSTSVARPTDENLKHHFCDYATQYYVAGRLAARAWLAPVHGNQLHHAVELYLKAALIGTLSLAQMKQKPYSHDIPELWETFKRKEGEAALARFDPTIRALDKFESIRYPDKIATEGANIAIAWRPDDVGPISGTVKMPPSYEVTITEVDQLVIEVLDRASLNPNAFAKRYLNALGVRDALTYENPHAARWL